MKRYAMLTYSGVPRMFEAPDGPYVKYEDAAGAKTLRDEFAMAALKGQLGLAPAKAAAWAYAYADAMLEARNANR